MTESSELTSEVDEVRRVVDSFPPLSYEQQCKIALLLGAIAGLARPAVAPPQEPHKDAARSPRRPKLLQHAPSGSVSAPVRCALYRHYDADGVLLYVGISETPYRRTYEHARSAAWEAFAERAELEWLPDRDAALAAEEKAIANERPLFNVVHAGGRRDERLANYIAGKLRAAQHAARAQRSEGR